MTAVPEDRSRVQRVTVVPGHELTNLLEGMPVEEAVHSAGTARFRAILLTSITTVAGLTPLLLEKSLQAQILVPLAASLAFGLVAATAAALFLVPAVYCILDDFGLLGALHGEDEEGEDAQGVPAD